ncbi:MAG: hypothetical protein HZB31_12375 [Nitrospirae bacterium]|nr:hypothetical protein [Nitrospirota bacterium]
MVESGGVMPGFSGKYYYSVDPKGRIMVPSPFREIISTNYNPKLYVVNALIDKCLLIYPQEEWLKLEEKVRQLPSMDESVQYFKRKVIASAQEVGKTYVIRYLDDDHASPGHVRGGDRNTRSSPGRDICRCNSRTRGTF